MAKLTRVKQKIFAADPQGVDQLAQIGSLAAGTPTYTDDPEQQQALGNYDEGWFSIVLGQNSPAIEDRNSLDNLITRQLAYLFQQGVPEWKSDETYYLNGFASVDGLVYVSLQNDNTNHPVTDEAWWRSAGNWFNAVSRNGRTLPVSPLGSTAWPQIRNLLLGAGGNVYDVKISPNQQFLSYIDNSSGAGLKILNLQNGRVGSAANVASISAQPAGTAYSHSYSPDGRTLAVVSDASPYVTIYDINGTTFTKQTNPSSLPAATIPYEVTWHPFGDLFAISGASGFQGLYQRSGTVFEKRADPPGASAFSAFGLAFSPDGRYLAATIGDTVGLQVWSIAFTGTNAFYSFTKLTDPVDGVDGDPTEVKWSWDSSILAVGMAGNASDDQNVKFYKMVGNTITLIAQTQDIIGFVSSLQFTPDDKHLFVATNDGLGGTNGIQTYKRTGELFEFSGNILGAVAATASNRITLSDTGRLAVVTQTVTGNFSVLVYKNANEPNVAGKMPRILNKDFSIPLW